MSSADEVNNDEDEFEKENQIEFTDRKTRPKKEQYDLMAKFVRGNKWINYIFRNIFS